MKKYKINISEEPHCQDLESLGSIFIPLMEGSLSAEDIIGTEIVINWQDIIDKEIATFCNPIKTKFDHKKNIRTLYLEVPTGGFALEIQHKEQYILDTINAYFGYQAIHRLNIAQNINMQLKNFEEKKNKKAELKLTKEENDHLKDITKEIKNEKLKKILINIGKNVISSQKE